VKWIERRQGCLAGPKAEAKTSAFLQVTVKKAFGIQETT
jgi:hypothetical protein